MMSRTRRPYARAVAQGVKATRTIAMHNTAETLGAPLLAPETLTATRSGQASQGHCTTNQTRTEHGSERMCQWQQ